MNRNRLAGASAMIAALLIPVAAGETAVDPALAHAKRLLRSTILVDGHNDLPMAIREYAAAPNDVEAYDLRTRTPGETDIPRLRAGGVGAQWWSVYIPGEGRGPFARPQLEQIELARRIIARYPDTFVLATSVAEIRRAHRQGKIASMLGMEGGYGIENSLGALRAYHALGVRYMALTHNSHTDWADAAAQVPARHDGLTAFGEEVVREMNRLGILVDLSHASPATMADALRVTEAPVIFSHSSARGVCDVPRNVPDDILREVKRTGGIVMATFVPGFVSPEVAAYNRTLTAETRALQSKFGADAAGLKAAVDAWKAGHPEPRATIAQVADHIDHIRTVAGIDHIGLGGDFDGITSVVQGLEHVGTYPALLTELARRGYSEGDLAKITSRNILRVMRAAEAVAASMKGVPPSIKTIEQVDRVTKRGQPVAAPAR